MRAAWVVLGVWLAVAAPVRTFAGPPPELPRKHASALATAARKLAAKGFAAETAEIQRYLVDWRAPRKLRDNLARAVTKALARKRERPASYPAVARALEKLAGDFLRTAAKDGDVPAAVARRALLLDDQNEEARRILGHKQVRGRWRRPFWPPLLERRGKIRDALRRAYRLPVKLERDRSKLPYFQRLFKKDGVVLRWRGLVAVHSADVGEPKLRRVLETALRASAVSHWIRTGKLEIPEPNARFHFALCGTTPQYLRWLDTARADGEIDAEKHAQGRQLTSCYVSRDLVVSRPAPEARWEAHILDDILESQIARRHRLKIQPVLYAGHLNWLCNAFLGSPMPHIAFTETEETRRAGERRTQSSPEEIVEREEFFRLSKAGLQGLRTWMAYLASRREDPPWKNSFVDEIGRIVGNDLLKATTVAEYLQEAGRFTSLMVKSEKAYGDETARAQAFADALGMPLKGFEERWREWIVPPRPGLAQRLGAQRDKAAAGPAGLPHYLDELRRATIPANVADELRPLRFDAELSAGCRLHALYLEKNPAQQQAWPDAHEQWPGKPGFSPAGSRAGLHSVIAFAIKRPEDAIDEWMGTFYHRLPLLDPGLLRIGWGLEKGIAVLDATSLAAPFKYQTVMVWPAPGRTGVPVAFRPELPNPVPGADQSAWGYPITIQVFGDPPEFDPRPRLFAGGEEVACHVSSPDQPTNPELAPANTWCLIPRQRLRSGTRYEVRCKHPVEGEAYSWTFKTR